MTSVDNVRFTETLQRRRMMLIIVQKMLSAYVLVYYVCPYSVFLL